MKKQNVRRGGECGYIGGHYLASDPLRLATMVLLAALLATAAIAHTRGNGAHMLKNHKPLYTEVRYVNAVR